MSDRLTIEQRHNNMAAIRGRDTKPEILVRKFLWSRGFIQVSAQSSAVAGQAGHRAEEISHLYSGERVLLART